VKVSQGAWSAAWTYSSDSTRANAGLKHTIYLPDFKKKKWTCEGYVMTIVKAVCRTVD